METFVSAVATCFKEVNRRFRIFRQATAYGAAGAAGTNDNLFTLLTHQSSLQDNGTSKKLKRRRPVRTCGVNSCLPNPATSMHIGLDLYARLCK